MDWHELEKKRVTDLRAMMKERLPEVTGVVAMKKEELVERLAKVLGIEQPHKVVVGIDKITVRGKIRALKELRAAALVAHDHVELKKQRRAIHRLKRRLRRRQAVT